MSTIKYKASKSGEGSIDYAFYGDSGSLKLVHLAAGTSRVAAFRSSFGDVPTEAVRDAIVAAAEGHGRKVQLHTYTLSFHPDEFDVSDPAHLDRIAAVGEKLMKRMHSAGYVVVVHADAAGGHGHAHMYAINHDDLTGLALQRYTSWRNGLRQLNDELMATEGLQVLPNPERTKPEWLQRREDFAPGGFEQQLGDRVAAALRDPRSVDRAHFEGVLGEHGVELTETRRDGWTYKMRRADNGKKGRKKASGLTPEFTAEGAQAVFDFHAQQAALAAQCDEEEREKEINRGDPGRPQSTNRTALDEHAAEPDVGTDTGTAQGLTADGRDAADHTADHTADDDYDFADLDADHTATDQGAEADTVTEVTAADLGGVRGQLGSPGAASPPEAGGDAPGGSEGPRTDGSGAPTRRGGDGHAEAAAGPVDGDGDDDAAILADLRARDAAGTLSAAESMALLLDPDEAVARHRRAGAFRRMAMAKGIAAPESAGRKRAPLQGPTGGVDASK